MAVRVAIVRLPALTVTLTVPLQPCALVTPAGRETVPETLRPLMRSDTALGATRITVTGVAAVAGGAAGPGTLGRRPAAGWCRE